MGFKIYRDFEHVWGTCKKRYEKATSEKSTSSTNKSQSSSRSQSTNKPVKKVDKKPANKWSYLRGNGDISIYHHAKLDAFLVTSVNPSFYRLYDRLVASPKTLIGVAMHWKDDDKSIGHNNYVYQYPESVSTSMFGKKHAIVLRGRILDKLKAEDQEFLEFVITDMETDISFAEQTSTEYR